VDRVVSRPELRQVLGSSLKFFGVDGAGTLGDAGAASDAAAPGDAGAVDGAGA
jgi:hypothetical protein